MNYIKITKHSNKAEAKPIGKMFLTNLNVSVTIDDIYELLGLRWHSPQRKEFSN